MSRFQKLSHVLWHCQYHLVWCPTYRFRVMTGVIGQAVHRNTKVFAGRVGCEVIELNVLSDHVHLIVKIPPKRCISDVMGTVKGRTAIKLFREFPQLKRKPGAIIFGLQGIVLIPWVLMRR